MDNQEYYIDLIRKDLLCDISHDELLALENWKKESANNRLIAEDLSKAWEISDSFASDIAIDVEGDYKKVAAKLDLNERKTPIYSMRWVAGLAAGLALIASVWYITHIQSHPEASYDTTIVAASDYEQVELPDKTKVILFEGTILRYNSAFSTNRKVSFQGKGYFNVAKDSDHPFVIESKSFITKVLGTQFLLDDQSENPRISLFEGKVSVQNKFSDQALTLLPTETIVLSQSQLIKESGTQDTKDSSWYNGAVTYDQSELKEVISDLERWYGIRISASDEIKNCAFSGRLEQTKLEDILEAIAILYDAAVSTEANQISITGGICQ